MSTALKCENCGAPLTVSPETLVAICSYCGSPNWVRETARKEIVIVSSKPYDNVIKAFDDYKRKRGGIWEDVVVRDAQCYYVPFILADISASAEYEGDYRAQITIYRREIRRRYNAERGEYVKEEVWVYDRTVIRTIHVAGSLLRKYQLNVLARRSAETKGVGVIANHFRKTIPVIRRFTSEIVKQPRTVVLATELSFEEVEKLVIDEARDRIRSTVEMRADDEAYSKAERIASVYRGLDRKARVNSVTSLYKRVTTNVEEVTMSPIIMLPVWILTYEYRNSVYKVMLSGWDLKPLVVEEPVTMTTRLAYHVISGLAAGIAGGLGFPVLLNGLRNQIIEEATMGVVIMLIGTGISLALTKLALRSLKVRYEK